jgi:molybdate transport system permease protein
MENGDRLRIQLESAPRQYQAGSQSFQFWKILALPLLLFIAIPLVALFAHVSITDLLNNLNQRQVIEAISLSLVTSFIATFITLIFGTPVAYLLAQRHSRSHRLVDTLIDLPLVLPPSVAGVALLMAFGRNGMIGGWLSAIGIEIPFTMLAVIMAQVFIASSFYVKAAAIGFASIDPELKQAASLDGAGNWRIFREIDLPLSRMALLSGSVMTWARALGEFGATIIFAGNFPGRTQTMPLAIYMGFEIDMEVALTLSVILIGLSFLTLIIVKVILHRRIDSDLEFGST